MNDDFFPRTCGLISEKPLVMFIFHVPACMIRNRSLNSMTSEKYHFVFTLPIHPSLLKSPSQTRLTCGTLQVRTLDFITLLQKPLVSAKKKNCNVSGKLI